MSDEVPEVGRTLPVKASIIFAYRIGRKCVVAELEDGWICAYGTDGTGRPEEGECPDVAPMGSIDVDPTQAQVYYHPGDEAEEPKILVVSPDNMPFRSSARGRVKDRSKSYNEDGTPVPEVLFLYALRTRRYDDRMRALSTLSMPFWATLIEKKLSSRLSTGPTFGQIFDEIQRAATFPDVFEEILHLQFKGAATDINGPSNLALWHKVAENAASFTRERTARASGEERADFDAHFLQAVRETTLEHGGLPAQCHVRERWIALANPGYDTSRIVPRNPGDWNDNRKKLGFDWLPPKIDWKRDWLTLPRNSKK